MEEDEQQLAFPLLDTSVSSEGKVVMRHDFETAKYSLSNLGQKLFYEILARVDSYSPAEEQVIRLSAAELLNMGIGLKKSNVYKSFFDVCEEVQKLAVSLYGEDEEYVYKGSINVFEGTLQRYKKGEKHNAYEAFFAISPKAAPYLTEITRDMRFNQFLVNQTRKLKKATSMRLYQWLRKYHWINVRRSHTDKEIDLVDLRAKLDFKNSYKVWQDFKKKLLEPAISEVCECTDLICSYQPGKTGRGRKVITLIFHIQDKPVWNHLSDNGEGALEGDLLDPNYPELDEEIKSYVVSTFPDVDASVIGLLATYPRDIVQQSLADYARAVSTKKQSGSTIKRPLAYFIKTVSENSRDQADFDKQKTEERNEFLRQAEAVYGEDWDLFDV